MRHLYYLLIVNTLFLKLPFTECVLGLSALYTVFFHIIFISAFSNVSNLLIESVSLKAIQNCGTSQTAI